MTNSSNIKRTNIITPESAAIFLPVIISTFLSIVIISAFVIPQYIKSNKIFYELKEFIRKKDELPKLKGQYIVINKKLKRLEDEKNQIIELISGKTNLETFVSRLGIIGKKNNIKFIYSRKFIRRCFVKICFKINITTIIGVISQKRFTSS